MILTTTGVGARPHEDARTRRQLPIELQPLPGTSCCPPCPTMPTTADHQHHRRPASSARRSSSHSRTSSSSSKFGHGLGMTTGATDPLHPKETTMQPPKLRKKSTSDGVSQSIFIWALGAREGSLSATVVGVVGAGDDRGRDVPPSAAQSDLRRWMDSSDLTPHL